MRIAFYTLGCKLNQYETEKISDNFEKEGFEVVPFDEEADVYLVNTCSVTAMADKKSRQMLHRARNKNADALVVAAGCFVDSEKFGGKVTEDETLKNIDLFVSNQDKDNIVSIVKEQLGDLSLFTGASSVKKDGDRTRAYVKIQDGCEQYCSYCIIPYVRGHIRSRSPQDITAEIRELTEAGYKEVVLTGIHISSYGLDLEDPFKEGICNDTSKHYNNDPSNENVIKLIEYICRNTEIKRLRLGSLEPRIVTEDFAKRLSSLDSICPQFHLSLQSGSDTVLKRMNRHYTTEEYKASCDLLKKYFDRPAITTDIIVGFPQETEEEFEETLEFAKVIGFSKIHIFKYSRREGTRADKMSGQVDENIKNIRSKALSEVEKNCGEIYKNSLKGKSVTVLTEDRVEVDGIQYFNGYTKEYVHVLIPADGVESNMEIQLIY